MMKFNGPKFFYVTTLLAATESAFAYIRWELANPGKNVNEPKLDMRALTPDFEKLAEHFKELGMDNCHIALVRVNNVMARYASGGGETLESVEREISEFKDRVHDALKKPSFLVLNAQERELFEPADPLFGQGVHDNFSSSRYDIAEAGKCMALERWTAAVLHLMRALEPALLALQTEVQASVPKDQWQQMILQIEKAIRTMDADLHSGQPPKHSRAATKDEIAWFSDTATHFRYLKDAWRNFATHGKDRYDKDEAARIYNNVRDFMIQLSSKLSEIP